MTPRCSVWLHDFVETSKAKGHITDCTLIVVSPLFGSSGQGRGENMPKDGGNQGLISGVKERLV